MNDIEILKKIRTDYVDVFEGTYPFPLPFVGNDKIKAILLGTDPGNQVKGETKHFIKVFGLENANTPYFTQISSNIRLLNNLGIENIYVQNVCKNYFNCNAYNNPHWLSIARDIWLPLLKNELDYLFDRQIPVLLSTELILNLIINDKKKIPAKFIYENQVFIFEKENYLERTLIPFYRHRNYSLEQWNAYKCKIESYFENH